MVSLLKDNPCKAFPSEKLKELNKNASNLFLFFFSSSSLLQVSVCIFLLAAPFPLPPYSFEKRKELNKISSNLFPLFFSFFLLLLYCKLCSPGLLGTTSSPAWFTKKSMVTFLCGEKGQQDSLEDWWTTIMNMRQRRN